METLGQKLRTLRKNRRMTQHELGNGLVTASMISQVEADRTVPSGQLLAALAQRLGVDPSYFQQDKSMKTDQAQNYRRAKALMDCDQFEQALAVYETLITPQAPQFREHAIYTDMATCYERLGKFDEALKCLERIVAVAFFRGDLESVVHAFFKMARCERLGKNVFMAKSYLRQAAQLLERHAELHMPLGLKIHVGLGRICLALHQRTEALHWYRKAQVYLAEYPNDADRAAIHHGLASVLLEIGDYDAAAEETHHALRAYESIRQLEQAILCQVNLAVIERRRHNIQTAEAAIDALRRRTEVRNDPVLQTACDVERVLLQCALGQYDEALTGSERLNLTQLQPGHRIELLEALADAHAHQNRWEEAMTCLQTAEATAQSADLKHDLRRLLLTQMQLLQRIGRHSEAADAASRFAGSVSSDLTRFNQHLAG